MSKLVEFLENMGRDADLAAEYEKDPDAVLSRYELSDEERKAVKEGDLEAIKRMSGLSNIRMTNSNVTSYE